MNRIAVRHEVEPQSFTVERCNRSRKQGYAPECFVQCLVSGKFVLCKTGAPEAFLVESDVPVGQVVADKVLDKTAGTCNVVVLVSGDDGSDKGIETADDPAVEH